MLLDGVLSFEDGEIACRAQPRVSWPYVRDGQVASLVTVELMAQATAAHASLVEASGVVSVGYVVAVRRLRLLSPTLHVGDILTVHARPGRRAARVRQFECAVHSEQALISEAQITVYQGPG